MQEASLSQLDGSWNSQHVLIVFLGDDDASKNKPIKTIKKGKYLMRSYSVPELDPLHMWSHLIFVSTL